jgi:hypothetical protein
MGDGFLLIPHQEEQVDRYAIKQTKVSERMIAQLKVFSARKRTPLQDLYEDAVFNLLKHRRKLQENGMSLIYLASPKDGKELNLKIRKELSSRIARIADADHTHDRRFLYTALVHYAKTYQIDLINV